MVVTSQHTSPITSYIPISMYGTLGVKAVARLGALDSIWIRLAAGLMQARTASSVGQRGDRSESNV